jgi:YidC/Oxa1 family membrane protein insertase
MFDFIGDAFKALQQALGSVLAFFYDILVPPLDAGFGQGLAIILLTIFISLVIFPLTLKQTRATRAFSAIQPEIKRIQKEYKDDPPEMQKRLMETQKSAGATPGGCLLPLLVQMPIWFALFRLLSTPFVVDESGELVDGAAHAMDPASSLGTFILSEETATFLGMNLGTTPSEALAIGLVVAIPYFVMMALMGTTQYVQTWHSTYGQDKPTGQGAGAQQMITKIMPLFIVFISYNFPAGLVLYWTTSNLFRFGQQVLIFKIDGRPPPPGAAAKLDSPEPGDDSGNGEVKGPQQGAANKRRRRRRK